MIDSEHDDGSDAVNRVALLMRQANTRIYMFGLQIAQGAEFNLELRCECGDPMCSAVVLQSTNAFALQSPPGSIVAHQERAVDWHTSHYPWPADRG